MVQPATWQPHDEMSSAQDDVWKQHAHPANDGQEERGNDRQPVVACAHTAAFDIGEALPLSHSYVNDNMMWPNFPTQVEESI